MVLVHENYSSQQVRVKGDSHKQGWPSRGKPAVIPLAYRLHPFPYRGNQVSHTLLKCVCSLVPIQSLTHHTLY